MMLTEKRLRLLHQLLYCPRKRYSFKRVQLGAEIISKYLRNSNCDGAVSARSMHRLYSSRRLIEL